MRLAVIAENYESVSTDYITALDIHNQKLEAGYETKLSSTEWSLCLSKTYNVIVFYLVDEDVYRHSKSKKYIYSALKNGKQVIVKWRNGRYDIDCLQVERKNKDKSTTLVYHPSYQCLLDDISAHYQLLAETKQGADNYSRFQNYLSDVITGIKARGQQVPEYLHQDLTPETVEDFVRTFAYSYSIQVDYDNMLSLIQAYHQIEFYIENNMDYIQEFQPEFRTEKLPVLDAFTAVHYIQYEYHVGPNVQIGNANLFDAIQNETFKPGIVEEAQYHGFNIVIDENGNERLSFMAGV